MSLDECMKKHTYRQKQAWLRWLRAQWNKPDRTDHYLMQIAQELRKSRTRPEHLAKVTLETLKIIFRLKPKPIDLTPQEIEEKKKQATIFAKARWLGQLSKLKPFSHKKE